MVVKKANVLLIEDDSLEALAISQQVQAAANSDFMFETADRLSKGLEILGKGGVDLVLIDLPLPGHRGMEVIKLLRERSQDVPIVVIAGGGDDQLGHEAVRHGAQEFVVKDRMDGRMLIQSMRHAIELKRAEEAYKAATQQLTAANKRLESLAHLDSLTQVMNRSGIERALEEEFKRAQRGGWLVVAVLVDCDDFDRINESLGHRVGDVVLQEVVGRLKDTLRPTDHIARTGGNEFLLLLPETRLAEGMLVAEKIRLAVAESPLRLASETIRVTASLGVMALPYDYCSIEEILSLVRLAVRESKTLGKNRVSAGEKHKVPSGPNKEALEELTDKLRQGDCFRAVSMPIYDLTNQKLIAYEILSRGPAGAFEMPDDLFRVSVEYDLLTLVDLRCLKTCLQACVLPKFDQSARFHVNLFPSTILDTPIERLMNLFPSKLKKENFCIEISEQQFIGDPAYLRDHVMALKNNGILVAIDDVGFGRSSLESLIILEPDIVKIDRKYVSGIATEPAKARLLKRLVKVVTALGAELIAEGIEQREELEILLELGVRYGQGWYWGKPS
jgi:diguanylate cyclase (GGDEF)-like protein